jgi:hypothetical protein
MTSREVSTLNALAQDEPVRTIHEPSVITQEEKIYEEPIVQPLIQLSPEFPTSEYTILTQRYETRIKWSSYSLIGLNVFLFALQIGMAVVDSMFVTMWIMSGNVTSPVSEYRNSFIMICCHLLLSIAFAAVGIVGVLAVTQTFTLKTQLRLSIA